MERLDGSTEQAVKIEYNIMSAISMSVRKYPLLVSEFFMIRGTLFIQIILKKMIDLEHYWGRVEFAPGRGQIHLHILAIMKEKAYLHCFYAAKMDKDKISVLKSYAMGTLGRTSDIDVKGNPSSKDNKDAKHNLAA